MATRLFPRASASDSASTRFPFAPAARVDGSSESQWIVSPLMAAQGSAAASHTISTVSGPTAGVQDTVPIFWVSAPIDRDITISGAITLNLRSAESSMNANAAINCRIWRIAADGTFTAIATTARTTELGTSEAAANFTVTPTSTDFVKGDRIGVEPFVDDAGTMGSGFTVTLWYAGAAGATGDTWVEFTETFLMSDTDPATQTLYPTNTASAVATASNDLEVWTSRGAGVQSAVTASAPGPTSGIQVTSTSGGTVVDWFTRPLAAATLSGPVLVNTRYLVSSTGIVAVLRCEIARVANDGSSPTVWGTGGYAPGPSGTTEVNVAFYVGGPDMAIADGERLRVRFYLDDDPEFGLMVSGHTLTFRYAGTISLGSGDSYLTFGQTLTEFAAGSTVSRTLTEALTAGDSWGRAATLSRAVSGSVAQADTWSRSGTLARTLTEALAAAGIFAGVKLVVRTTTESLAASDAWSRAATLLRALIGGATAADSWGRIGTIARSWADAATGVDVWTRAGTYARTLPGAVALADSWAAVKTTARAITGSLTLSDTWTRAAVYGRSIAGGITASDAWTRTGVFARTLTGAVAAADAWARSTAGVIVRGFTGALAAADSWARGVGTSRGLTGALAASDSWVRAASFTRTLAEAISPADAWDRTLATARSWADSVVSSDVWSRAVTTARSFAGAVSAADSWARATSLTAIVGGLAPVGRALNAVPRAIATRLWPRGWGSTDSPDGTSSHPKPGE